MQCLLHSKIIQQACSADSSKCLKQLVSNYEGGTDTVLDCMDVRTELGSPFDQHDQQDPTTYLEALVIRYPSLSPLLQHSISVELQCDVCKVKTVTTKQQVVMSITIPEDSKSLNMNDLISTSQQRTVKDTHVCVECNVPMKLCTQIVDAKQLIVLKLDVWNKSLDGVKMVRRKANITSVQNSSIKVEDKLFALQLSVHLLSDKSAILALFVQMVSGYTAITRYYHVNADLREPKICIWLFMNKSVTPSNRSLTHCMPKQQQKARPLLNGNYHQQVNVIKDLVQKKYVSHLHRRLWYTMKTGVV